MLVADRDVQVLGSRGSWALAPWVQACRMVWMEGREALVYTEGGNCTEHYRESSACDYTGCSLWLIVQAHL